MIHEETIITEVNPDPNGLNSTITVKLGYSPLGTSVRLMATDGFGEYTAKLNMTQDSVAKLIRVLQMSNPPNAKIDCDICGCEMLFMPITIHPESDYDWICTCCCHPYEPED
jgi:hypothetical protein